MPTQIKEHRVVFSGYIQMKRLYEITKQQSIIKDSEEKIKSYWNLPNDYKGEFPFNCTNFDTNQHYEAIKRAKTKLILLGVNPDGQ